jgi:hypothetical protein
MAETAAEKMCNVVIMDGGDTFYQIYVDSQTLKCIQQNKNKKLSIP